MTARPRSRHRGLRFAAEHAPRAANEATQPPSDRQARWSRSAAAPSKAHPPGNGCADIAREVVTYCRTVVALTRVFRASLGTTLHSALGILEPGLLLSGSLPLPADVTGQRSGSRASPFRPTSLSTSFPPPPLQPFDRTSVWVTCRVHVPPELRLTMAFFVRSKKVKKKKNAPAVPAEKQTKMPSHHPPLPQPPSQASQCRQVSPSQRSFSPPSAPGGGGRPQYQQTCPPVIVNQHYYLGTPPYTQVVQSPHAGGTCLRKLNLGSAVDLAKDLCQGTCIPRLLDDALPLWHDCGSQLISHGNALIDQISDRFDNVLTVIDQGGYDGEEHDISSWQPAQRPALPPRPSAPTAAAAAAAAAAVSEGVFAKVDLYANSKLPMNLPPLKLYVQVTPPFRSQKPH